MAGLGIATAATMMLGSRRRASEKNATAKERTELALQRRKSWQLRLAVIALAIGCLMMFVLAGIAAWLSFGAQREYAHAHNGGDWDAATGFALLLDAGALSLSLIRFFEALTLRSSAITRILLLAFVSASAAMNLLHAPEDGAGTAFLAMVPPLVYAVMLEMLLFKIEQVLMGRQKRRKADHRGYSLLLWLPWPIGAPVRMWKAWRSELLATVDNVRVIGSHRPRPSTAEPGPAEMTLERVESAALTDAPTPALRAATEETPSLAPATKEGAAPQGLAPPAGTPGPGTVPEPPPAADAEPADPSTVAAQDDPEPEEAGSGLESGDHTVKGAVEGEPARAERWPGGGLAHDEEGPDPEHGASDDEVDEETRERVSIDIDLSVLPTNLSQRQRAERIYIAHQAAGVPLSHADLGSWAGYKNANSGGNEYRRLERTHGPILVREGATHVDLTWSDHDERARSSTAAAA
ncbi:DUF2637 domain-containing protein [Streptomyces californicus]|uniref:DUF2637 domain-containing protein n=1 Tax=Streptomyces californicus TaxID=67351 RepID=UPI0033E33843